MVGAVLHQEMLLGGRRFSVHAMRWIYGGWLVLQVFWFWVAFQSELFNRAGPRGFGPDRVNPASAPEVVGARFSESFVQQQVLLLLLLTPALCAGAITDEKRKGTLQHLLLTDMEARHIILGKMLGRLAQVLQVMIVGLPLFALMAGFGGVAPITLVFVAASLLLPLVGLAALTMLASVWFQQTRDAILALYVLGVAGALVVLAVGGPLRYLDPLFVIAPAWGPVGSLDVPEATRRLIGGAIGWGLITVAALTTATVRLRPAYLSQIENVRRQMVRWYSAEREPIDSDPVQWRERHVEGLVPNTGTGPSEGIGLWIGVAFLLTILLGIMLVVFGLAPKGAGLAILVAIICALFLAFQTGTLRTVPQWLAICLIAALTTLSSLAILFYSLLPGAKLADLCQALLQLNVRQVASLLPEASTGFLIQGIVTMLLASLVVGIRCSGAVTAERERQTWEAILLTPMSARQIVHGKLWGVMGASYWYLLAYAAPAVSLSVLAGPLGLTYTVLWLAATVLAMYFIGAAGLWCSVQAKNSWRSLLHTVLVGYVGGLAIYAVTSPIIGMLAGMLLLVLMFIDVFAGTALAQMCFSNRVNFFRVFAVSSAIGLAIIFFLMARLFLYRAQRWVADRDRTRHWHDEPYYRQPRRVYGIDRAEL